MSEPGSVFSAQIDWALMLFGEIDPAMACDDGNDRSGRGSAAGERESRETQP
jgi:hypothetical protein